MRASRAPGRREAYRIAIGFPRHGPREASASELDVAEKIFRHLVESGRLPRGK